MAARDINFVEGEGISIQASLDVHQQEWQVEIANTVGGQIDVKGDLIAGVGDDTAGRLPVGTDGQVLTADSSASTGLAWADSTGGSDPAADTKVWMPLVDSDGTVVLDDTGLIPTLITLT
jgi:hypothetical protein